MVHHVSFVFRVTIVWFNLYLFRNISTERGSLRRGAYNLIVALLNKIYNNTKMCYNIVFIIYIYIIIYILCVYLITSKTHRHHWHHWPRPAPNRMTKPAKATHFSAVVQPCGWQAEEQAEASTWFWMQIWQSWFWFGLLVGSFKES